MTPPQSSRLDGIGSHDEFVDRWKHLTGARASNLHGFHLFSASHLAAINAKSMSMFVAQGRTVAGFAEPQLRTGLHAQLPAGLLGLTPPAGVNPLVPDFRLDR